MSRESHKPFLQKRSISRAILDHLAAQDQALSQIRQKGLTSAQTGGEFILFERGGRGGEAGINKISDEEKIAVKDQVFGVFVYSISVSKWRHLTEEIHLPTAQEKPHKCVLTKSPIDPGYRQYVAIPRRCYPLEEQNCFVEYQ